MSEIALYNILRKMPNVSDAEAKEAVADIANAKDVATKADIAEVKAATKADIAEMKAATKADIAEVKTEIAEVKTEIAEVKTEVKTEIAEVKTEIAELRAQTKADIAEIKAGFKYMQWAFGILFVMNTAVFLKLFF